MHKIVKLPRADWPKQLLEMADPPERLYLEGTLPDADQTFLTVVGSRKFTNYGKDACEKIISGLAGYPVVIVSGLAIGIDTIAHKAALRAGLKTLAIPGSGLDRSVLHPSSNARLADEIVAKGGALLSEYEPATPAGLYTFPKRNRIMAGISRCILVVEAGEKSGTLITARLALDYNREVCAIPGPIFSSSAAGTNGLIRQGATPITSSEDMLVALGFDVEAGIPQAQARESLTSLEKQVVDILIEPLPRDELIQKLKMPTRDANVLLGTMEIKGIITESAGEFRANI
jgi:DNA processing protein